MWKPVSMLVPLIALATVPVVAQSPPAATFRTGVDVVTLTVTVTDRGDHAIRDLTRDDFTLREDGVEQPVTFFGGADVPLDLALVIDASASMGGAMPIVKRAATGLVRTLTPRDRVSVLEFRNVVAVAEPLTADLARASARIAALEPRGTTGLYNALYVTLRGFADAAVDGGVRRRALVVFSDGDDTASLVSYDDVLDLARRSGVAIYMIALRAGVGLRPCGADCEAVDFGLRQLAEQTGARAFFPRALADVRGVYTSIASELASQYALGYVPTRQAIESGWRRLSVTVHDRPGLRTRARQGYYASPVPVLTALLQR